MNSKIPPEMLERLRRCLALTMDKGAFENEAATALRIANSIMEKYGLSMADVDIDAGTGHLKEEKVTKEYTKPFWAAPWEKKLARVPAYLLPVEMIFSPTSDNHISFMYVGTVGDAALAVAIFEILRKELLRISRQEFGEVSRKSFLYGCVTILANRAYEIQDARKRAAANLNPQETSDPGKALVVVKGKDIKAWVEKNMDLKPVSQRGPSSIDEGAYERGKNAGKNINLDFHGKLAGPK